MRLVQAIILDPKIALHTPQKLWLSTGIRALDHACETLYRPGGQYPLQQLALSAIRDLFTYLPQCVDKEGEDVEARGRLQVAAWMSLFPSRLETALGPCECPSQHEVTKDLANMLHRNQHMRSGTASALRTPFPMACARFSHSQIQCEPWRERSPQLAPNVPC